MIRWIEVAALGSDVSRDDACPNCEHSLGEHLKELGCGSGWDEWNDNPKAPEGCDCPLALAEQYNPPSERD